MAGNMKKPTAPKIKAMKSVVGPNIPQAKNLTPPSATGIGKAPKKKQSKPSLFW
jgi:hypothetical protein